MKALVTGANGHIGSHILRAARSGGIEPIAFVRPGSDRRAMLDLDVEVREGDLRDADSVERAMSGVEVVFHAGAVHRNWAADHDDILRPAIDGTRNVLLGARKRGVRRIVLTSSGATVGFTPDPRKALDESSYLKHVESPYARSKIEAEAVAREEGEGLEVVTVNPSGVFGPRDYRLTPATRAIMGLVQGDPAFFHVCITDVRDVAEGHVLAATRGHAGERYLLTGDPCSPEIVRKHLQALAGVSPPLFRPPRFLAWLLAWGMERKAGKTGGDAGLTRAMVADNFGRHLVYDSSRARRQLGVSFRAAREVLRDTLRWLLFVDALTPKAAGKVRAALGSEVAPDADWER
jgi:dihydroflavonol-4-reductase